MLFGISEMVNVRAFKPYAIVYSIPENLLLGISRALGTKESYFLKQNYVLRKCCGVYQKW